METSHVRAFKLTVLTASGTMNLKGVAKHYYFLKSFKKRVQICKCIHMLQPSYHIIHILCKHYHNYLPHKHSNWSQIM